MPKAASTVEKREITITDMQLGIDKRKYTAVKTYTIPSPYAKVILPGHDPEIIEGLFGIMISQWLNRPAYKICVCYYIFTHTTTLLTKTNQACTVFFMPVKSAPIFKHHSGIFAHSRKIPENVVLELQFNAATSAPRMTFRKGTCIALHITVPDEHQQLLQDRQWLNHILEDYKKLLAPIIRGSQPIDLNPPS
jgi:hypothetical protein